MTHQFKVGDKVEFVENYAHYKIGDVVTVKSEMNAMHGGQLLKLVEGGSCYSSRVKLAKPKKSKNERITELEAEHERILGIINQLNAHVVHLLNKEGTQHSQVQNLINRIEALENGPKTMREQIEELAPLITLTPNQQRAEIIEKAKKFVEDCKQDSPKYNSIYIVHKNRTQLVGNVEFIVNEEKRTVAALIKGVETKRLFSKGIAKCNPSDVFNEHIGKAIALGRALGLDVSEFEQAVQPTEIALGMQVINNAPFNKKNANIAITVCKPGEYDQAFEKGERNGAIDSPFMKNRYTKIINDTNAQY